MHAAHKTRGLQDGRFWKFPRTTSNRIDPYQSEASKVLFKLLQTFAVENFAGINFYEQREFWLIICIFIQFLPFCLVFCIFQSMNREWPQNYDFTNTNFHECPKNCKSKVSTRKNCQVENRKHNKKLGFNSMWSILKCLKNTYL